MRVSGAKSNAALTKDLVRFGGQRIFSPLLYQLSYQAVVAVPAQKASLRQYIAPGYDPSSTVMQGQYGVSPWFRTLSGVGSGKA